MNSNLSIKEVEKLLKEKKIIIYGTGHIGKKFILALKRLNLVGNITCFAKTGHVEEGSSLDGIPVCSIGQIEVDQKSVVCLAVHDSIKNEMINELRRNHILNYIWIYPYLYELILGFPVKESVSVKMERLIEAGKKDYRMAIRFLAIEQYLGKNDCGFDIYVKSFSLHCSEDTAQKRLGQFCELIEAWLNKGYNPIHKVQLSENYEIIDGNHRVALAMYFGEENIVCDIFSVPYPIVELHGDGAMLTKEVLLEAGFTAKEIQLLDEMKERSYAAIKKYGANSI